LFEHDIYFQSVARGWRRQAGLIETAKGAVEYLRAFHYESKMLRRLDLIQTCSRRNTEYLLSFFPELGGKVRSDLRAGIDVDRYDFQPQAREVCTMLFVGSFRHLPNQTALFWFIAEVLPLVVARRPLARLVVVGSDPPPPHTFHSLENVDLHGPVDNIGEPLARYGVFVCPVLSGSGVRVKLLEAFAAGIPVVSTRLGAEGITETDGDVCRLADDSRNFAGAVLDLMEDPAGAVRMAARAREMVESNWDIRRATERLVASYEEKIREKATQAASASPSVAGS
jgi:glycosyltransferase involved in cell wall biosynthesis